MGFDVCICLKNKNQYVLLLAKKINDDYFWLELLFKQSMQNFISVFVHFIDWF